jgi:hypothetical protein
MHTLVTSLKREYKEDQSYTSSQFSLFFYVLMPFRHKIQIQVFECIADKIKPQLFLWLE